MSVAEQRYQAVLAVIGDGRSIKEVAEQWRVSRQTLHTWLARYEVEGLEGLADRSHRPASCPHQLPAEVEALMLELRRSRPYWGPRRLVRELGKRGVDPVPSESAVYRSLVRNGQVEGRPRRPRREQWKRWERAAPNELWQLDVVGGFLLADGSRAKALTGIDDHSRFCVSARLMPKERTQRVCDAFADAMRRHGVPQQVLTDNGKVFTGRYCQPPVEVLFDRICRENGVEHLLTQPRSPTTTGKIERFHRTLRTEFDTTQIFRTLTVAQQALDEWVEHYNSEREHSSIGDVPPVARYRDGELPSRVPVQRHPDRTGEQWVSRRIAPNGVVCVSFQQVCVGKHYAGSACDVLVTDQLLQFWVGNQLLKTVARTSTGNIRKKNAQRTTQQ